MERNNLMSTCYPKIKDYCREKHGLEFQVREFYIYRSLNGVLELYKQTHRLLQPLVTELFNYAIDTEIFACLLIPVLVRILREDSENLEGQKIAGKNDVAPGTVAAGNLFTSRNCDEQLCRFEL